jgi:hypothetical protein
MSKAMQLAAALALSTCVSGSVLAQRVGQSATVQFGVVRDAKPIDLTSDAPRGALVGGTLGLVSGRGSTSRSVRNGIIGAGAAGALTAATEGSRQGMSYVVEKPDGSSSTIVTDQREIQVGDCVAIEQVGQTANIRRTSASYCERANTTAVASVETHTRDDAMACASAKQELVDAQTKEAADLAARKIELLCNA